jgi:geranylgeranyl diphosphate synthase, type III
LRENVGGHCRIESFFFVYHNIQIICFQIHQQKKMAAYETHVPDESLLEAFRYISQIPGKDIRGKLIDAFQVWMQIPEEKIVTIKEIITELHNASLLVDDIEDGSHLRRGIPVAHAIYGVPTTINTANYVYFLVHIFL